MHFPVWLFPAFIGFFLVVGALIAWFSQRPVIVLSIAAVVLVFLVFLGLEVFFTYNPPNFSSEKVAVSALIAGFAALPILIGAFIARLVKRRKQQ